MAHQSGQAPHVLGTERRHQRRALQACLGDLAEHGFGQIRAEAFRVEEGVREDRHAVFQGIDVHLGYALARAVHAHGETQS